MKKKEVTEKMLVSEAEHRTIRGTKQFAEMDAAYLAGKPVEFKQKIAVLSDKGMISAWIWCARLGEMANVHLNTMMGTEPGGVLPGGAGELIAAAVRRVQAEQARKHA